jgi:hypothetical protein
MKKNIGTIDKIIRVLLAIIFAVLYFAHIITGTLGIILLALGGVFILTSLVSFCPIWWSIKISTNKKIE